MALSGMLADVTQVRVRGLLQQRDSFILDETDNEQVARFEARVEGAAVAVVLLVGSDPTNAGIRALAIEAIACQTGSEIEYAEFPEQQSAGDTGRGWHLHQRYLELLAQLRDFVLGGIPGTGGAGGTTGALSPSGDFPDALPYPDPALGGC